MLRRLAPLAFLMALCVGASAPVEAQQDSDATVVDALVVRALGGPAWWRVSDADTTVYILGDPGRVPSSVSWETRTLERRLRGANELILPPQEDMGFGDILGRLKVNEHLMAMRLPGQAMDPALSPERLERFEAMRARYGREPSRYAGKPAAVAAMMLNGEAFQSGAPWRSHQGTSNTAGSEQLSELVWRTVKTKAEAQKVRVRAAAEYGVERQLAFLDDLSKPGVACFDALIADLEGAPTTWLPSPGELEAATAWADGDVRPMLAWQRTLTPTFWTWFKREEGDVHVRVSSNDCLSPMNGLRAFGEKMRDAEVRAVERALRRRGHAVAVFSIRNLVSRNGLLEQLQAKGYTITLPDVAED